VSKEIDVFKQQEEKLIVLQEALNNITDGHKEELEELEEKHQKELDESIDEILDYKKSIIALKIRENRSLVLIENKIKKLQDRGFYLFNQIGKPKGDTQAIRNETEYYWLTEYLKDLQELKKAIE